MLCLNSFVNLVMPKIDMFFLRVLLLRGFGVAFFLLLWRNPSKKKRRKKPPLVLLLGVSLPAQHVGEYERCYDGGIGLDDEFGRVHVELAPGDFFVGHGARVGAVAGGGVADLAEVGP